MVPQLPPELIANIIKLSLPHVAYSTFPERYDTLLNFHLVNKQWCALARVELFRKLKLNSKTGLKKMMRVVQEGKLESLLERTTSLWIGTGISEDLDFRAEGRMLKYSDFTPCIRLMTHLNHVAASNVVLHRADFAYIQGKSSLTLHQVQLGTSYLESEVREPFSASFPHLFRLDLIDPDLYFSFLDSWTPFVNPTVFPKLSQLSLVGDALEDFDGDSFCDALASVAPQLATFTFVAGRMESVPELNLIWDRFKRLKRLSLCLWGADFFNFIFALKQLPSPSLITLQIVTHQGIDHQLTLYDTVDCLRSLLWRSPVPFSSLKTVSLRGWLWEDFDIMKEQEEELVGQEDAQISAFLETDERLQLVEEEFEDWERQINWC